MERSLLEGKREIEVVIGNKKYTARELGAKRGARLFEYLGSVMSFAYGRFKIDSAANPDKTIAEFVIGLVPELIVKFVDQMCLAITISVGDESGEYVKLEVAEELLFPDLAELITAIAVVNADQINRTVDLLAGDVKKKILEAYPGIRKYFETEASPEVPTEEPILTPTQFTTSSNEDSDIQTPR